MQYYAKDKKLRVYGVIEAWQFTGEKDVPGVYFDEGTMWVNDDAGSRLEVKTGDYVIKIKGMNFYTRMSQADFESKYQEYRKK